MIGNVNNELNAAAKRNGIKEMFSLLTQISEKMSEMLALPTWYVADERAYDKLKDARHSVIVRLKNAGQFN